MQKVKGIEVLVEGVDRRFASYGVNGTYIAAVSVSPAGVVSWLDPVAGHYTLVHSLPAEVVEQAHKLADARRGAL